jgi:hypothetical protein
MLDRPHWKLALLSLGVVSACSLTVPSEDDVFGKGGGGSSSAGTTNKSGESGSGTAGTEPVSTAGGGMASEGGQPSSSGGGTGQTAAGMGSLDEGGAGGDTGTTPKPTGEIINPSFENGLTGWTVEPITAAVFQQWGGPGGPVKAHDGSYVLSTWDATAPYTVKIFQVIDGLEDGSYTLSVFVANKGGIPRGLLYAKNCGGTDPAPVQLSGSGDVLVEVASEPFDVKGGKCEIGLDLDARAADWVNADLFGLKKMP